MEKKMMGFAVMAFGLMFLVLNASGRPSDDMSCKDAVTALLPCQSFLVGSSQPPPTAACCAGAKNVLQQLKAATGEVRKALCECILNVGKEKGVMPERAKQVPELCKINVHPNVDCNK
jgi:hypothetical protein